MSPAGLARGHQPRGLLVAALAATAALLALALKRDGSQPGNTTAPQEQGVEQSLHTASIWLVDRRGRWRAKFSGGIPVPPKDIAHDLRLLLGERAS